MGHRPGLGRQVPRLDGDVLGQGAVPIPVGDTEHAVSQPEASRTVPESDHHTGDLMSRHHRASVAAGPVHPRRGPLQLGRGEARSSDLYEDITDGRSGPLDPLVDHSVEGVLGTPTVRHDQGMHTVRGRLHGTLLDSGQGFFGVLPRSVRRKRWTRWSGQRCSVTSCSANRAPGRSVLPPKGLVEPHRGWAPCSVRVSRLPPESSLNSTVVRDTVDKLPSADRVVGYTLRSPGTMSP